jgi:hypothetical protein
MRPHLLLLSAQLLLEDLVLALLQAALVNAHTCKHGGCRVGQACKFGLWAEEAAAALQEARMEGAETEGRVGMEAGAGEAVDPTRPTGSSRFGGGQSPSTGGAGRE